MDINIFLCLAIIVGTFYALIRNYAIDAVMLFALLATFLTGILTPAEALLGFANESIFTIALLFIIARSITLTGGLLPALQSIMQPNAPLWLSKIKLMSIVAGFSAFMSNTPIVSSFIPIIQQWCRQNGHSASFFLMPLSFASIVGGMCSLVGTSTNLILNYMYVKSGGAGFGLFEFALAGIPIAIFTIVYMLIASKFLKPNEASKVINNVREFSVEMLVIPNSRISGITLREAQLRDLQGIFLIEIIRDGQVLDHFTKETILKENDRLIFIGDIDSIVDLESIEGLELATDQVYKLDNNRGNNIITEVVVSTYYPFSDRKVKESNFRRYYGAAIIAISREGMRIKKPIGEVYIKAGDVLILEANPNFITRYKNSRDFLVISEIQQNKPINLAKRPLTIAIVFTALVLASLEVTSLIVSVSAATIALLLFKCINLRNLRNSIDQQVVLTIAAAIALGTSFSKSGTADYLTSYLTSMGIDNIYYALALLFTVTAFITALITNVAAAVLMFPIAMNFAELLNLPSEPFIVTIAFACSACYATPIGYQTNLMVMGPGGYRFSDFLRIGLPLTILTGIMTVILTPMIWL